MEESFRRRFTLTMHIGMPNEGDRALILKHLLRKYFCLITDAQYQRLGEQAKDLTGGDLEVIVYDVYNRKENHRIEAGFMQQCPIRSTLRDPVYVPCGPYAKRRIAVRPLSIAMLADHVEIGPITYRNVLNAITRHTKTVPERLVEDHIAYSKNKDHKPAEETKTVKHVIENNPK
jgi:SpoVK/Ycf46/Vps4 family AAA+-type ATPase